MTSLSRPVRPVLALLPSGGRDETNHSVPDRFLIDRSDTDHLAFGYGVHHCIGAALVRLESRIAISRLFTRFPEIQLARPAGELRWRVNLVMRGVCELPGRLHAAQQSCFVCESPHTPRALMTVSSNFNVVPMTNHGREHACVVGDLFEETFRNSWCRYGVAGAGDPPSGHVQRAEHGWCRAGGRHKLPFGDAWPCERECASSRNSEVLSTGRDMRWRPGRGRDDVPAIGAG